jgi:hypothetical protein
MKGGRKLRAPGPTLHKELQNMTSEDRISRYIKLNNAFPPTAPTELKRFNAFNAEMKHRKFAEDATDAENRIREMYQKDTFYNPPYSQTSFYDLGGRTIEDVLKSGGKTRRNRRRGRGRRSLKHYSKRR